ncbi:MAG: hypothetical protein SOT46_08875 [Treponema sp.]|nr:hypothetical protein [Spirochaetia bacterium]MDY2840464.1 hypothetical protein [Treponema sp.]MDY5124486.1 hypothetical protein [Treponema sp.]
MKKLISLILCAVFSTVLFAATNNINEGSLKAYRTAKSYYENQEYGRALKNAEDAILFRRQQAEYEIKVLTSALSPRRVQLAGDNIYDILKVLNTRGEKEAISIINLYINKKGIDFFNNSIKQLLDYINDTKSYPEAQKLIGDIYRLEGEYDFAESYYLMALDNKEVLDIPDEQYEILYTLAEISKFQQKYDEMEIRLLNILTEDSFYKDNGLFYSMMNTIKGNKQGAMEKYFLLYRANSYYCLSAYNQLALYYESIGEKEKALNFSALSVITSFSKIINILERRNADYNYTGIESFFNEVVMYDDIMQWSYENNFWQNFNNLARITAEQGYYNFSKELLLVLVEKSPDVYWQKDAVLQLSKIK